MLGQRGEATRRGGDRGAYTTAYYQATTVARRTPSISAPRIYVYKHVYIYFLADGQAWAVESLESGNLMVY